MLCGCCQGVCIELSRHLGSLKTPVTSKLIHWATASAGSSSGGGGSCAGLSCDRNAR